MSPTRFIPALLAAFLSFIPIVRALEISEILTENEGGLQDADFDSPGWIELHNETAAAVNVGGWRLTDDLANLAKWTLPAQSIAANGYLVVFASGKNRAVAGAQLHTNFQLDPDGEYLALVRPDGTVAQAFAPEFPKLRRNVSYSESAAPVTTTFVAEGAAVRYIVPVNGSLGTTWTEREFIDGAWTAGASGLGFDASSIAAKFDIKTVSSLASIPAPAGWTGISFAGVSETAAGAVTTVNTTSGAFNVKFDAVGAGVTISSRNRQGGASDILNNAAPLNNVAEDFLFANGSLYAAGNPPGFNITVSGVTPNTAYPVMLWAYDRASVARAAVWTDATGGASATLTFSGADGQLPDDAAFNARSIALNAMSNGSGQIILQGRAAASGSAASHNVFINALQIGSLSFTPLISTNVSAAMQGTASSLYARASFNVSDPAAYNQLRLRIRYDDGFFAWVNGQMIASRNAPGSPAWNAAATSDRAKAAAVAYEEIVVPVTPGLLAAGANVLAVQGLSQGLADADFVLMPVLEGSGTLAAASHYFATPTPGAANGTAFTGIVADTEFSVDRGFFSAPFTTDITCATPGAQIRYTTDGSPPAAATGTVYSAPVNISGTTILRAAAFVNGLIPSNVDAQSYLYISQAVTQPPNPPGWPATWGPDSEVGGTVPANYEMDPVVRNNTIPGYSTAEALEALPSLSIALAPGDFLGANGIYQNPRSAGAAWEKPCSLEMIDTDGSTIFKETCGIEIHGGSSRRPFRMQKHSFRVSFKGEYGAARLRKRLFPDSSMESFDKLILRACFTDSWGLVSWDSGRYRPDDSVYFRDIWMKRTYSGMGHLQTTSRFAHVYINGLYWGIHDISEKIDEAFLVDHRGGLPTQWDVLADFNELKVGDRTAWDAMFALGALGLADQTRYTQIGTQYLDVPGFADYYLLHVFAWCEDWPGHNWYAVRRRDVPDQFRFLVWDQEIALDNTTFNRIGDNTDKTPGRLFQYLRTNPEFRLLFADRVQRHVFNGGALSLTANQNRWSGLAAQLDKAIVAESARWGDTADETPYGNAASKTVYTREADWLPTVNNVRNVYLPSLYNNVNSFALIPRLRANTLFPSIDAPAFSQHGGNVAPGYALTITAPAGAIFYTLDGTDPREAVSGNPLGTAYSGPVTLTQTAMVKTRARNGTEWSALTEAQFIMGTAASAANIVISEVCYNPPLAEAWEFVELQNISGGPVDLTGVQFSAGITYAFAPGTLLGAGQRLVLASESAAFAAKFPGVTLHGTYTGKLDNSGEQIALTAADAADIRRFSYNDKLPWPLAADGNGHSMTLVAPATNPDHTLPENWRASVLADGTPGGGDAIPFTGNPTADSDGDGLPDLLEYALGDPPASAITLPDGTAAMLLSRRAGTDDARVIVEFSADLASWSPLPATSLEAATAPVSGGMTETWKPAPGSTRTFLRARVQLR